MGVKSTKKKILLQNTDIIRIGSTYLQVIDLDQTKVLKAGDEVSFDFQSHIEAISERKKQQSIPEILEGIGPYLTIEVLGYGSFGTVYKAIEERQKNLVALKVSTSGLEDAMVQRFLREAELLKRLKHPAIIQIYDRGIFEIDGENRCYLALEYFQGVNGTDYIRNYGPLPWEKLCKIAYPLVKGLDYMHQKGILHRDLKPDNILYNQFQEVAKIIDLGLGKCISPQELEVFLTTASHSTFGTPDFMPIEQWHDTKSVNEKADIYALGGIFYFLLTTQAPHGKHSNLGNLYEAVAQNKRIPLAQALKTPIPQPLLELIEAMMCFHAKDRLPTLAILEQLQRLAKSHSVTLE
jgi:serine/threonine protein kinase